MSDMLKKWFKDSETILWARLQMLLSILLGGAAAMDWSPLIQTGLTKTQLIYLIVVLFIQGLVTEAARRARDPDLGKPEPPTK